MPHVTLTKDWTAPGSPEAVAAKVEQALKRGGLAVTSPPGALSLAFTGGSGCMTRLLGGWFVGLPTLPKRGTVAIEPGPEGSLVKVQIEDTLGFGIVDPMLKKRFEESFTEIVAAVESATGSG